ncbi:NAD-dependent epimerase/dehydratase family protein [Sphingomonas oligophenolica]|uniref:NAD-dependent epimerase/dehydratase family protein n=1 Tax=Sphingomonas oligophenolica TaxID=301154 RepID=A0A502CS28_9SPHN|nr:NAD(P)H-binding protein [Sphingomonas oligophenolica]TPG14606.1 NAD-dependent epimerase/dehydratase family protein [Sphingomonas oligophenolica]
MSVLSITGGTGFVGRATIDRALAAGHEVRALARRPQAQRDRVTWVTGALDDPAALATLARGADAVIHIAGVVNAARAGFIAGNIEGTRAILAAAQGAGVRRFVHVSSLSAREPQLSDYGWSKAEAEKLVEASGLDWIILRPAAVYGPGDMEMRDLFRAAKLGIALLPPPGVMSAVAVDDLARLLVTVAERGAPHAMYEVDDGTSWTHADFACAIGTAVGRPVMPLHLPRALMLLGARIDGLLRGDRAKLTRDRVGYLAHPDWTARPDRRVPAALWSPLVDTREGLAETARWYRANGLL